MNNIFVLKYKSEPNVPQSINIFERYCIMLLYHKTLKGMKFSRVICERVKEF